MNHPTPSRWIADLRIRQRDLAAYSQRQPCIPCVVGHRTLPPARRPFWWLQPFDKPLPFPTVDTQANAGLFPGEWHRIRVGGTVRVGGWSFSWGSRACLWEEAPTVFAWRWFILRRPETADERDEREEEEHWDEMEWRYGVR